MKIRSIAWHNVTPDAGQEYRDVTNPRLSRFKKQLRFIVDNYTPIPVHEFVELVKKRTSPTQFHKKPPILLGFDDGFRNVVRYALPVLREFNVPSVFFITGEVLRNPDFIPWFVEMKYLFRKTRLSVIHFGDSRIHLNTYEQRRGFMSLFERRFKSRSSEDDRQELMTDLAASLEVDRPQAADLDDDHRFVGLDELQELNASELMTIGSHALTHRNLSSLSYREQVHELETSDTELRKYCRYYYPVVSYPDGSFNRETLAITRNIYKFGFAVLSGSSYRHSYAYPRCLMGNDRPDDLHYVLSAFRMHFLLPIKKSALYKLFFEKALILQEQEIVELPAKQPRR